MKLLEVEQTLNTSTGFFIGDNVYNIIEDDPDDGTKYKCMCKDTTNHITIASVPKELVPDNFKLYEYKFKDVTGFEDGKVIYAYKKDPMAIKEIQAIIIRCTTRSISFLYRNTGGEHVTALLTPLQVFKEGFVIQAYEKPVIK